MREQRRGPDVAPPMRRLNPLVLALAAIALIAVVLGVLSFTGNKGNQDRLSDDQVAGRSADDPERRCAAQSTYDRIKRELFRRAGGMRGSDQAAFDKLAAYSVVRMDAPLLRAHDEETGRVSCEGSLALDLPPGVAVVGGRRTLTADIGYTVQPAADGNGEVVTISGADAILIPLATLARVGDTPAGTQLPTEQAIEPAEAAPPSEPTEDPLAPEPADQPDAAPEPRTTSANPSFNCRLARTRGEIAVCNDVGLANLDRQMAGLYFESLSRADAAERALLQRTRTRFLSFRDSCASNSCIADAYRGRIREIRDIMAGRWQPAR